MAGSIVETTVGAWEERLSEIRSDIGPKLAEAQEIEQALAALRGNSNGRKRASTPRKNGSTGGKRGRPADPTKGRKGEFLKVVQEAGSEGIKVPDAAKKMKVNPGYLYRIAKDMMLAGFVQSDEEHRYTAVSAAVAVGAEDEAPESQTETPDES